MLFVPSGTLIFLSVFKAVEAVLLDVSINCQNESGCWSCVEIPPREAALQETWSVPQGQQKKVQRTHGASVPLEPQKKTAQK